MDAISMGEMLIEFCPTDIKEGLKDAKSMDKFVSGAPVISAIAFARLGLKTGYIGKVGNDDFGILLIERLKEEGIDTSHVIITNEASTSLAFVEPDVPGIREKRKFIFYLKNEASGQLKKEEIKEDYIKNSKALHFPGSALSLSNVATEAVITAVKYAKKYNVLVSFDPNIRLELLSLERIKEIYMDVFELCDVIQPNLDEASLLLDAKNEKEAADRLLDFGAKYVVIKLGEKGCFAKSSDGIEVYSPSFKVPVSDTTGAGDVFSAAFVTGILKGWELKDICKFANACSAIAIQSKGATSGIPTFNEVMKFLEKN